MADKIGGGGGFMHENDQPAVQHELLVEVDPVEVARERRSENDNPDTRGE